MGYGEFCLLNWEIGTLPPLPYPLDNLISITSIIMDHLTLLKLWLCSLQIRVIFGENRSVKYPFNCPLQILVIFGKNQVSEIPF